MYQADGCLVVPIISCEFCLCFEQISSSQAPSLVLAAGSLASQRPGVISYLYSFSAIATESYWAVLQTKGCIHYIHTNCFYSQFCNNKRGWECVAGMSSMCRASAYVTVDFKKKGQAQCEVRLVSPCVFCNST